MFSKGDRDWYGEFDDDIGYENHYIPSEPWVEERIYMDALKTNYRLENWPQEDLEAYCGIL